MDAEILGFLKRCRLQADNTTQLEGQLIPRSMLISQDVYDSVQSDVIELKKKFSSSALTSLQSSAQERQKWPLLNLVRQILRVCNYQMKPVRCSDGYDENGKKKYIRYFMIVKHMPVKAGELAIESMGATS